MSAPQPFRLGSLFAGIGGFDLAARWMGWSTAWVSEIEPYACRVLAKHFPEAVNHGDITAMRGQQDLPPEILRRLFGPEAEYPGDPTLRAEPVDILCGGFPCQDISLAGKGAGLDGARSGLWAHYARLIGELRPRWVVAENVAALRTRGLDRVLADLAALGYDAEWHCIPASAVGAPHRRDRIWILARPAGLFSEPICTALADANGALPPEPRPSRLGGNESGHRGLYTDLRSDPHPWATEPDVGRVAHGVPARVDRLRCLGNAVVPQVPLYLFRQIARAESALAARIQGLVA